MYVITGATGNTGRRIAEKLLASGKQVRVIGRNANRLQSLVDKGARAFVGSLEDKLFLFDAFQGATAAYVMIPPDYQAENLRACQNQIGEAITAALIRAEVKYVVNLSSLGAHLPEGTGPILGLHDQEQRLNKLEGVNIVHLRPTYFMENLFIQIPMIQAMGINGTAIRGDQKFPVIATQDIAAIASEHLLNLDFTGVSVRELLGPKDLSMNEMTDILGEALGREDLPYVQFPYEEAQQGMTNAGLSTDFARAIVELNKGINEGIFNECVPRSEENTTGTSFNEFAKTFTVVYQES
jgi:uncharacterized protein YbjT (DUF2867 family)